MPYEAYYGVWKELPDRPEGVQDRVEYRPAEAEFTLDGDRPDLTPEQKRRDRYRRRYEPTGVVRAEARRVRDALRATGFNAVLVEYDGGGDEGFATFEAAERDGEAVRAASVARKLKTELSRHSPLVRLVDPSASMPRLVLDGFAEELAAVLFGGGWGVGELAMAGRFRADLETGTIADLRLDPPPDFADRLSWLWEDDDE